MELGHLNKHFVKHFRKRAGKNFGVIFLLDPLKTAFLMENLIQKWILSCPFFQNQGIFFDFQENGRDASPLPPCCGPALG